MSRPGSSWYKQFGPATPTRDLSQVSPLFSATAGAAQPAHRLRQGRLPRMVKSRQYDVLYELPITTRTTSTRCRSSAAYGCPGLLGGMEWNGPAYARRPDAVRRHGRLVRDVYQDRQAAPRPYYGGAVTPTRASRHAAGCRRSTQRLERKKQWPIAGRRRHGNLGGISSPAISTTTFSPSTPATARRSTIATPAGRPDGGVISYEIGGKQYVAMTSGVVSGFFEAGTGVIVFAP
jgi:alcohol dehydrogenase (cytochrome c)